MTYPNDITMTGRCCCVGCIGMGPCDLDLGRLDEDAERDCRCGDICTCGWEDDDD